jgi:para-aminobenzoate synthetase/4-amino-4-deoxychorismate lyase
MHSSSPPDPARGLFETLLLVAGEPLELDAHLDRLAGSLRELFGSALPQGLADEVRERASAFGLGRLRIDVAPGAAGARARLSAEEVDRADLFPTWERGARLSTDLRPGGLGRHKWADRRSLDDAPEGSVWLLLDRGEEVLEATRGNVFAAFGGVLTTPPADGRILPGIGRSRALAVAAEVGIEAIERPLRRDELLAADEVFLSGSVRGVEPVREIDGVELPASAEVTRRVGAELRRRWLGGRRGDGAPALAAAPPPGLPAR